MAPHKTIPFREVKRKREEAGFAIQSQKGSHIKFIKSSDTGTRTAVVPRHKEIPIGTLKSILRQAGIKEEEFDAL